MKRQRCCSGTAKGAQLSILYDFFILTHEYIAVLRKSISRVNYQFEVLNSSSEKWNMPSSSIIRKFPRFEGIFDCKILGTVWIYRPTPLLSMQAFCMTQLVSSQQTFGFENGTDIYKV